MKLNSLVEAGDPERLATGFKFTEGPVWMPGGSLVFSDISGNRIYQWSPEAGVAVWRDPSDNSNGLTLDTETRLVACEHGARRVSRTEPDGTIITLADRYRGKRLNSPNDIVAKSDGSLYFTDPVAHHLQKEDLEQPCNGLYRILPDGTVERLVDDIVYPNGLAFSPDESILYVVDSERGLLLAYDVHADGTLTHGGVLAEMDHPQNGFHSAGPDGMKVDVEGNLYVTGADGIWVFEPDGTYLGNLVPRFDQRHAEPPANLTWGDADRKTLYVTACSSIYRFRMKIAGAAVPRRQGT
ncbi:MAG TPA: gluconolactonase [Chloroflexi bacterium]|nr:gluconolactonase [Chloroflexota bacterium]